MTEEFIIGVHYNFTHACLPRTPPPPHRQPRPLSKFCFLSNIKDEWNMTEKQFLEIGNRNICVKVSCLHTMHLY